MRRSVVGNRWKRNAVVFFRSAPERDDVTARISCSEDAGMNVFTSGGFRRDYVAHATVRQRGYVISAEIEFDRLPRGKDIPTFDGGKDCQ
jgi:hypothetical protein